MLIATLRLSPDWKEGEYDIREGDVVVPSRSSCPGYPGILTKSIPYRRGQRALNGTVLQINPWPPPHPDTSVNVVLFSRYVVRWHVDEQDEPELFLDEAGAYPTYPRYMLALPLPHRLARIEERGAFLGQQRLQERAARIKAQEKEREYRERNGFTGYLYPGRLPA